MSLRVRLFLLLGALVALLVVAEWSLVRSLSRDLSTEIDEVAFRVGESVVASVSSRDIEWSPTTNEAVPSELAAIARARTLLARPRDGGADPLDDLTPEETFLVLQSLEELAATNREARIPRLAVLDEAGRRLEGDEARAALEEGGAQVVVALDSPAHEAFLRISGPRLDERIPIPREGVEDVLDRFRRRLLAGSGLILLVGLAGAGLIAHGASSQLRRLSDAARRVGEGDLGTQVPVRAGGEVGAAITAFNAMSARLAELDATARRLRESEHLGEIGEVGRGLAHGLRNPLHALGLTLDELRGGEVEPHRREEMLDGASRQIRRIDQAIRSFLALATASASGADDALDVGGVVEDVVLEALQDARGRVSIKAEVAPDVPPIRGVPAEVHALVQALVVNAVEASPDGARVVVRVGPLGDGSNPSGARVEVEDEGPGLAPEVRRRLFEPHVTTKASGAGMGLFLAHRIATARHGGALRLDDREGAGTRAVLDLPAGGADD